MQIITWGIDATSTDLRNRRPFRNSNSFRPSVTMHDIPAQAEVERAFSHRRSKRIDKGLTPESTRGASELIPMTYWEVAS